MLKISRRTLLIVLLGILAPLSYYLYFHVLLANFGVVVPGQIYRSGQPSPAQLARWIGKYGLKTVLDLRGDEGNFAAPEKAVTDRMGVALVPVAVGARSPLPRPALMKLMEAIESAPKPMLIHCASGVERSGTVSALAAMAIGGKDYDTARSQAYIPLGPLDRKDGSSHISDVLREYEEYCAHHALQHGGWKEFRAWAAKVYMPLYYDVDIAAPIEIAAQPGQVIDVDVAVTNKSDDPIPASDPEKKLRVAAYTGGPEYQKTSMILQPETSLPPKDVPPGGTLTVKARLTAPAAPGAYEIFFDIFEGRSTSFSGEGSEPRMCLLHVASPASIKPLSNSSDAPVAPSAEYAVGSYR
jgi:protein tyrosine phosphatase (PTP) superfamily phosphohydrolase (DUF442 family)